MPEQPSPGPTTDQPSRARPLLFFVGVAIILLAAMAGGLSAAKWRSAQLAQANPPSTQTATTPDSQPILAPTTPEQSTPPSQPAPSSQPSTPTPQAQPTPAPTAPKPTVPATGPEDVALIVKAATFAGLAFAGIHYAQSRRRNA